MDNNKAMATPPWTSIRDLEYASLQLEKENLKDDAEYAKWLNMLIAPGSSLGGARPKANILDNNGALWIAKFPSGHDTKDMGAWEAVTAEMARKCGIEMDEIATMYRRISNNYGDASFSISLYRIVMTIFAIMVSCLRLKVGHSHLHTTSTQMNMAWD